MLTLRPSLQDLSSGLPHWNGALPLEHTSGYLEVLITSPVEPRKLLIIVHSKCLVNAWGNLTSTFKASDCEDL